MTQRVPIQFVYHPDGLPLKDPVLVGSWDSQGCFNTEWIDEGRPLEPLADGRWGLTIELECEEDQKFWWGVKDRDDVWLLFGRPAIAFIPSDVGDSLQVFSLGNRHLLGLNPLEDGGFTVGVWAPHARSVDLVVDPGEKTERRWGLESRNGIWSGRREGSLWSEIEGRPYGFSLITSEGQTVLRADPYARRRQGSQKGVSDLYVTRTGAQTHRYARDPQGAHLLRFEAIPRDGLLLKSPPVLRFFKEDGAQLDAAGLRERLLETAPLDSLETWWTKTLSEDGSLVLVRRPDVEAYAICLGSAPSIYGLEFRIEDENGVAYHDSWGNLLDGYHEWSRLGIVSRPLVGSRRVKDPTAPLGDLAIYELHIGSIMGAGGNLRTSTFGEVAAVLPKIKEMGFTAVAMMPTNPSEGNRDWGYLGTASMAHQEAYANPGQTAEESLIAFIEAAHALGLSVFTDVVYNHVGGNHNDLWNFDGGKNPWFEWATDPELGPAIGDLPERPNDTANAIPQTQDATVRNTPWGPIPAYNKRAVFQFFIDHAMDQVARIGFDGIRFDFTHLIHTPNGGGGNVGWLLLQEINRRLKHFYPETLTFAEEFPQHPIITTPVDQGGAGFDAMWNTEHQHRLVYSEHTLSVTQSAVVRQPLPLQRFLDHLLNPAGFSRPSTSVTVLSNHDEVGNAIQISRLVASHPRGHDLARLVCWLSLLCPGYPIIFQGTEDMSENGFTWGIPSSWDGDSHLRGGEIGKPRLQHLQATTDVLVFRQQRRDLHSEVPISNHLLDKKAQVVAFRRAGLWVVANFGDKPYSLPARIRVDAPELLSSELEAYGYARPQTKGLKVGSLALKVFASTLD